MNKSFNLEYDFRSYKFVLDFDLIDNDFIDWYQSFRYFDDEYQSNEPEIETDNFFYSRFLKRK